MKIAEFKQWVIGELKTLGYLERKRRYGIKTLLSFCRYKRMAENDCFGVKTASLFPMSIPILFLDIRKSGSGFRVSVGCGPEAPSCILAGPTQAFLLRWLGEHDESVRVALEQKRTMPDREFQRWFGDWDGSELLGPDGVDHWRLAVEADRVS
jgi:hypothetical protein